MHNTTVAQLAEGLRKGEYSSVEITRAFLARIAAEDDRYNSFITVDEAAAIAQRVLGVSAAAGPALLTTRV